MGETRSTRRERNSYETNWAWKLDENILDFTLLVCDAA